MNLFLFFPFWIFGNPIPYFIPPDGWECVHPQQLDSYIQIAFLGKGQSDLRPSLNLAVEEIDIPLNKYIKAVREIHETEMKVAWRDLGPFTFKSGKGRLAEITSATPLGEIKMLQGIFVQEGHAYILTGAVLKEDFSAWQNSLLNALHSLSIVPDLFTAIADPAQRSNLQEIFRSFDQATTNEERQSRWSSLQKTILADYGSMGAHWQLLILKEGRMRIFNEKNPSLK